MLLRQVWKKLASYFFLATAANCPQTSLSTLPLAADFCLFFAGCLALGSALAFCLLLPAVGALPVCWQGFWLSAGESFWLLQALDFACLPSSPDNSEEDEEEEDEEETAFFFEADLAGVARETEALALFPALAEAKGRASSSSESSEEEDEDEEGGAGTRRFLADF